MSKYHKLRDHLNGMKSNRWAASLKEVEEALGFPLPQSARKYPAWWSNEIQGTHVQTSGWIDAGWKTENIDLHGQMVVFVRMR